jgi:predicted nucleic acid-binding protein
MQRKAGKKMRRWIEDWVEIGSGKRLQVDENDLWICAQAKERDLVVVTGDTDIRQLASLDPDLKIVLTQK